MTTPTDIDRTAPVMAHHEIDIAAPLERVWDLHTNVEQWPTWNAEVSAARLDGPFVAGGSFTWTSYDFTVTSTIYDVEHRAQTLWGGAAQGIMGTHEWLFERTEDGVRVITNESFAGDPAEADTAGLQVVLDSSLTAWLSRMKARAESTD
jgi:uncharacterized protein YndB with AHSA1/START domain